MRRHSNGPETFALGIVINGQNTYIAKVPLKHNECFQWFSKNLRDGGRDLDCIKKAVHEKFKEVLTITIEPKTQAKPKVKHLD